jgi:DNA-binding PadR family transcriptional regulator
MPETDSRKLSYNNILPFDTFPGWELWAMTEMTAGGGKPLTSSVFYILLALSDSARHGLGIAADVEERTGGDVQLGPGTLYNAIKKMLADGLIEVASKRPDPENDDPRRRYYSITPEGQRLLRQEAIRLDRVMDAVRDKRVIGESRPA